MLDDARGDVMTARHPARAALAAICDMHSTTCSRYTDVSPPGPGPLLSVVVVSYCDSSLRVHRGSPQGAKKAANGGSLSQCATCTSPGADARASPPRFRILGARFRWRVFGVYGKSKCIGVGP